MSADVIHGDCLDVMRDMDTASVDAVVTDPPYGLKFMGKHWDHSVPGVPFWAEALRLAKPGTRLLAFGGTRTYHRMACAIEDAGWQIEDSLCWLYGSGFPKHKSKLKPAHEPIVMARKPASRATLLNVDECRIGYEADDFAARVARTGANAGKAYGSNATVVLSGGELAPANPSGRWPANVVLDEEAARALDEMTGERAGGYRTTPVVCDEKRLAMGAWKAGHVYGERGYDDTGGPSRYFYTAKASRAEREAGLEGFPVKRCGLMEDDAYKWEGGNGHAPHNTSRANGHPTVKPVALMRWLVRLVTPPNGLVLDPFTGSGTTGIAATLEGRRFVGIEREAEYVEIARARIAHHTPTQTMLAVG